MRAISLFSGVGGFDLGFERAGIETVLQVEQDPHCLEVLARQWPDVERLTDVRALRDQRGTGDVATVGLSLSDVDRDGTGGDGATRKRGGLGHVDLVYGGFPCQDVSLAGTRAGLAGDRSGLWFEFERIVSELRPRWVIIENVPGLLSSNEGRDFAVVVDGLAQLGFDAAWAILDAQHFGVAQRRRRVFIVGGPRGRSAAEILSLCESCGGVTPPSRAPGKDLAGTLGARASAGGFGFELDASGAFIAVASAGHHGQSSPRGDGADNLDAAPTPDDLTPYPTLSVRDAKGPSSNVDQAPPIVDADGVRRLTPLECERLQGFPDGWTAGQSDSARYKQMGNAVAVPVAEWIGHRLVAVDRMLT